VVGDIARSRAGSAGQYSPERQIYLDGTLSLRVQVQEALWAGAIRRLPGSWREAFAALYRPCSTPPTKDSKTMMKGILWGYGFCIPNQSIIMLVRCNLNHASSCTTMSVKLGLSQPRFTHLSTRYITQHSLTLASSLSAVIVS